MENNIEFPLLVEEFLEGTEISVETFTVNGHHLF